MSGGHYILWGEHYLCDLVSGGPVAIWCRDLEVVTSVVELSGAVEELAGETRQAGMQAAEFWPWLVQRMATDLPVQRINERSRFWCEIAVKDEPACGRLFRCLEAAKDRWDRRS